MSQLTSSTASRDALSPLTGSPRRSPTAALRVRTSVSTQASELNLLPLPYLEDARALVSRRIGGPGIIMSVLALPARPRRAVPHLRAAPTFLVDAAAFVPRSPGTQARSSPTPRSPPKVRRRPAPLKLASAHTVRTRRAVAQPPLAAPAPAVARAVPTVGSIARAA